MNVISARREIKQEGEIRSVWGECDLIKGHSEGEGDIEKRG